jgi:23S rRNA pseudouridine1911/1915/1917 synthase
VKPTAYTIGGDQAGASLLEFLARSLDLSKGRAKSLLDARCVLVNRRRVWMARHALCKGDLVEVIPDRDRPARVDTRAALFEDAAFLVVDKPSGVLSNGPDSLEDRLRRERKEPALQAVHRLDRDTTGCLLFARDASAFEQIVELFKQHEVSKSYDAIVHGTFPPQIRVIDAPVDDLPAVTHVSVVDAGREATHVRLRIETGRTHQIRRHLELKRHPVVGDRQYATRVAATDRSLKAPRQMLHASELAFKHPRTGAPIRVRAPLPRDFLAALRVFGLR